MGHLRAGGARRLLAQILAGLRVRHRIGLIELLAEVLGRGSAGARHCGGQLLALFLALVRLGWAHAWQFFRRERGCRQGQARALGLLVLLGGDDLVAVGVAVPAENLVQPPG